MKFAISKTVFLNALNKAVPIAGIKGHMPIFEHVRLRCEESTLSVAANSLESALTTKVPCSIEETGVICVPAKRLLDVIKACSDDIYVSLERETLRLTIKSGGAQWRLSCLSADVFPEPSTVPKECVPMPIESLCGAIESVIFAAASKEFRFNLNAICIAERGYGLELTTTDGHRLARRTLEQKLRMPEATERVLLPKSAATTLLRLCDPETKYALSHKLLFAVTDDTTASFRLLDDQYPDVAQVIPNGCEAKVYAKKSDLVRALDRVSLFNDQRNLGITITISNGKMVLASTHSDLGDGQDSVDINYGGDDIEFIMNSAYLGEMLRHLDGETVRMDFAEIPVEGKPVIFRTEPEANPGGYFGLIMPMRK